MMGERTVAHEAPETSPPGSRRGKQRINEL